MMCIECANWQPENTKPPLAGYGHAYCPIKSIVKGHTFFATSPQECDAFVKTTDEIIKARFKFIGRNIE